MRLQPYEPRIRRLLLRGGPADGLTWEGEIDVGRRIACGTGAWSPDGVYVVTRETTTAADGQLYSIAVPVGPNRRAERETQ